MSAQHAQTHAGDDPETHHEESDVNIRAVFGLGAALLVITLAVHVAVWLLYMFFTGQENRAQPAREFPMAIEQQDRMPPEPRLQTAPREDLREMRTEEDGILNTYGWVDRNAGVVRIPIGEAMKLTLQRGLPSRPAAAEQPAPAVTPDANSAQPPGNTEGGK